MVKERKLRRWLVSVLSGAIVATSVLGSSFVSYAVDDDLGGLVFDNPDDNDGDQGGSAEEPSQDEPEVKENITESGNGLVYTDNSDGSQSVSYDKEISGMLTEDSTQKVVDEKTAEQEQIKAGIEGQGGSYDYTVDQSEITLTIKKEIPAESEEVANEMAEELKDKNGQVKVETVETPKTEEKAFGSVEEAQAYEDGLNKVEGKVYEDDKLAAAYAEGLEKSENIKGAKVTPTGTVTITTDQTDFEGYQLDEDGNRIDNLLAFPGYHIEQIEGERDAYRIVITGGVEEIKIDFAWFRKDEDLQPGDYIEAKFYLVNESRDDYEIDNYTQTVDKVARWMPISYYDEEIYGKPLYTFENDFYGECVGYATETLSKEDQLYIVDRKKENLLRFGSISYFIPEFDEDGNVKSYERLGDSKEDLERRKEWCHANCGKITKENVHALYDAVTGKKHDTLFEAWQDFCKMYVWETKYYQDKKEKLDGSEFFTNERIDLSAGSEESMFWVNAGLDGPMMDSLFENTNISTLIFELTIKALEKVAAKVDYTEIKKNYSVTYDEDIEAFVVTVTGSGYIPGGGGGGDDPGTDPGTLTVTPTPGEAPAVLGAQRELPAEAPAVLGARRAGTSDETNMVLRLILIAASASVLAFARKKSENR